MLVPGAQDYAEKKRAAVQTARLERLCARYVRDVIAGKDQLVHHGDCYIFKPIHICSCGLLHDLVFLDHPEKLYAKYEDEHCNQLRAMEIYRYARQFADDVHEMMAFEDRLKREAKQEKAP